MKVFIGTEAAEGMGHVAPWANFAQGVLERGWEIHMAAPNVGQVHGLLGVDHRLCIWQAPVLRALANDSLPSPKSWPELLLSLGYAEVTQLTGVVKAWISILKSVGPSVVLADYAPGLILAAHVLGVPCLEVGGGFCVPPLTPKPQPFPGAKACEEGVVDAAAQKLISSFDQALRACGYGSGIANLSEMESWPVRRIVTSTPQMDHYGQRPGISYSGFLSGSKLPHATEGSPSINKFFAAELGRGTEQCQRIKVLGYLKPETPGLDTLIDQLCSANVRAYLAIPDAPPHLFNRGAGVAIVNHPIDLAQGLEIADVYLSNGGLHGLGLALESGCWPVVVPMQAEQVAMVRNLVVHHWGSIWLPKGALGPVTNVAGLLRRRSQAKRVNIGKPSGEEVLFEILEKIADVR